MGASSNVPNTPAQRDMAWQAANAALEAAATIFGQNNMPDDENMVRDVMEALRKRHRADVRASISAAI